MRHQKVDEFVGDGEAATRFALALGQDGPFGLRRVARKAALESNGIDSSIRTMPSLAHSSWIGTGMVRIRSAFRTGLTSPCGEFASPRSIVLIGIRTAPSHTQADPSGSQAPAIPGRDYRVFVRAVNPKAVLGAEAVLIQQRSASWGRGKRAVERPNL